MRALVTGATGFVGTAVVARLAGDHRHALRAVVRRNALGIPPNVECIRGDLAPDANWQSALAGVDVIVHLAARVHVMKERSADALAEFRRVNVDGTSCLARQAAAAGVRRFISLSSIKIHGELGTFRETDVAAPVDAYGISKYEAETALRQIAADTGMEVVIIRAPLIYGVGVRANFLALIQAVARGIPLPFGAIHNRRSLLALDNLVDFIRTCIEHPAAANETFLVSDGDDLSTTDLIRRLAHAMDRPARLIPVPVSLLMTAATLLGKQDVARRLLGSLTVDIAKARHRLDWTPPVSVDEGLKHAVTSRT